MTQQLEHVDATIDPRDICSLLARDGAVIVENALTFESTRGAQR